MAGPSDRELIAEIQAGRRDALGLLFDRYSPTLYEFIYRITGDPDTSPRLLEEVFARVPSAIAGLGEHESIRGWLYSLAREASLTFLRQEGWLDALPLADETTASGIVGDIWRAARSMPAFFRAALVAEELHGLSPTEKARALNVARTDLPRLLEEARRVFDEQFDQDARRQGRPLAAQVDPERIWGIHRRLGDEGSLFGYLPAVTLPESMAAALRSRVLAALRLTPPPGTGRPVMVEERTRTVEEIDPPAPPPSLLPEGCSPIVILAALAIALLVTASAACLGFFVIRDATPPSISRVDPPDGAELAPDADVPVTHVVISAVYRDDRAVDVRSIRLLFDGQDVTAQSQVTDTGITYEADVNPGPHVAYVELRDTSGNRSTRTWQFTVLAAPEATPTPTLTPTITPVPTETFTPAPTATATPPPAPVINSFSASQSSVAPGTPVLLTWSVSGAKVVFLNQDRVDASGSRMVNPAATTVYHLIANNDGGTTEQAVTITVQALPDLIIRDIGVTPTGQLTYVIRNAGTGDVTQMFLIQVFADGVPIDSNRRVSNLGAGQEVSLFVPNYTLVGTHVITVRVNATHEIEESNLNNDELTRTIAGPTPTPTWTPTITSTPVPTNTPVPTPTNTPTITPTPTAAPVIAVSAGQTSVSPYTGNCPGNFIFVGSVTTSGATTVTYQWERAAPYAPVGPFSLAFDAANTKDVTNEWTAAPTGTWSERLHVLGPNDMASGWASFTNSCTPTP